jgi:hypothetical protein
MTVDMQRISSDPTPATSRRGLAVAPPAASIARLITSVDTPDPHTAILHWRQASPDGGELARGQLHPLPRHVLETPFTTEKESFTRHPYFTDPASFVGNGAYRAVL